MYICGNTEERSSNYSCVKKGLKGTFSRYVSADFIIQHEKPMRRITFIMLCGKTKVSTLTHYVYQL